MPRLGNFPADARSRGWRVPLAIHRYTIVIGLIALGLASPNTVFAVDVSWIDSGGGLWSDPLNWSTTSVPGPSDRAIINLAGTYTITLDANASVVSLVLGGGAGQQTLIGLSRTLTATDSVSVASSGVLDLSNSTVNATLFNRGLLVARRTSAFNGVCTNEAGGTLRILGASGGSALLTAGALTNRGTLELTTIDATFQATLTGSGTLTNAAGGLFRVLPGTGGERHLAKPMVNQGMVTLTYPLYLDNGGLSQLNDTGGTIEVGQDLVLTQNGGSTFTNQGTVSFSSGRYFTVSAGTFANSGTLAGTGNLLLNGATVTGSVSAASTVLIEVTNCTVNAAVTNQGLLVARRINTFNGQVTIETGATLRNLGSAAGSALLTLGNTVTNRGTIELTTTDGGSQSILAGGGTLTNQPGGVFRTLLGTGGERHLALLLINQGTVTLNHHLYLDNAGKSFLNQAGGTIDVAGGDLIVSQTGASPSFTNQGTVNLPAGRNWSITGGTFTNSGTLAGTGNLFLASLTANLNTLLTLTFANTSVTSSTVHAPSGLVIGAGAAMNIAVTTVNGAVTNQGVLVARQNSTLNGTTTNAAGATLRVLGAAGGSANLAVGPVTNQGAIEITTIDATFQATLSGSGPVSNEIGSTFRVLPGTGGERHLATRMVNRGTVTLEYPLYLDNGTMSQLNDVGGMFDVANGGDVVLTQTGAGSFTNRGTLHVGAGRVFAISGGTFLNDVAGTLRGSGTISSSGPDIVNAGTISPGASPGRLSFTGKVVQAATGRVRIELSGTQAISEYDVLSCSGQLVLGGTLELALLEGFVPPAGSAYVAIKYGTHTGTFSSFEGLDLGGGLEFAPTYTDTAVILSTGPLAILAVTSNRGGNSGAISVAIHGLGLFAGQTVRLARGAEQIPAQILAVSPYGTCTAVAFDLTGATLGAWDVVVEGTAGGVTLPGGFTVEEGRRAEVTVQIVGRARVRVGQPTTFEILCTNTGNVDALGAPIWIGGIPAGAVWSLSPPLADPPPVPGATPIDYSGVPIAYGTAADSTVGLLLYRMPPGLVQRLRLTVHPTTTTPFHLRVWSNPTYFHSPPDPALIQCVLGIMGTVFSCAAQFAGAGCAQAIVGMYFSTSLDAFSTGFGIGMDSPENLELGCSLGAFMGGTALGMLETSLECAGTVLPIFKVWNAIQCALSIMETVEDCSEAMGHESEAAHDVSPVTSFDPNDKVGSSGVGSQRFVRGVDAMPYAIYFENLGTATAPAAEVVIRDTLDMIRLDVKTVALGPIRFGQHVIAPPPGSSSFLGTLDLRPGTNLVVKVDVRRDTTTGVLTWRLSSIDPDTGAPPVDPDAGFLPPNLAPPEGEGSVQYSVMPLSGLSSGDQIGNRAAIVFDTNPAILTPVWTNTVDATAPVSAVASLPPVTSALNFVVRWQGSDLGSHVKDYTIYWSVDGGPDSVWRNHETDTSAVFIGKPGHTYAFYSIARDSAGNREAAPAEPDAQTSIPSTVDVTPGTRVAVFALHGARPNPADARVRISFELPTTMPGALDLYDLAGRRTAHRDIGGLGAGVHTLDLGEAARIRPGIYFVRLQHGGREAVKKIVVSP